MRRLWDRLSGRDSGMLEKHALRVKRLTASNRALRREVRDLHDAMVRLTKVTDAVELRTEQLMALHREDVGDGTRLARFEAVFFDAGRIAAHIRAAVAEAELVRHPFPHLLASDLLPPDVHDALLDAIPERVFFDAAAVNEQRIPVPPQLAPLTSILTWQFVAEQIVNRMLVPALTKRFQSSGGGFRVSETYLALRQPGGTESPSPNEPLGVLSTIIHLVRPGEEDVFGTDLYAPDSSPNRYRLVKSVPSRPNTALTFLHTSGAHTISFAKDAPAGTERYTLQFRLDPSEGGDTGPRT